MARRKQEPISQNRVRTNRLRAIQENSLDPGMADFVSQAAAEFGITPYAGKYGNRPTSLDPGMADFISQSAAELGITPYAGEYRNRPTAPLMPQTGPQLPITSTPVARGSYTPPTFSPVSSANPYLDYTRGLTAMADQATANFGTELADVQNRYKSLRDQVLAQFGNTKNPELIAARDIALAELSRQSDDATKQVAANYQAAQADQFQFAQQQRSLGAELGAQNAILANVAAGNIAAYSDQAGLTDSSAQDISAFLSSQAPREQALATSLGLSSGMFESSMGTSLGEQQMAIQGQIARDLAARQGQVSTSTAQQIAASQQAEREAGRQAYLNLVMEEMGALDRTRSQMSERDFALRQGILQGGVEAGRFNVEQNRYNQELQMQQEDQAYNRFLAGEELNMRERELASNAEQRRFENEITLGRYQSEFGSQGPVPELSTALKISVGRLIISTNPSISNAGADLAGLLTSLKALGDKATAFTQVAAWFTANPDAAQVLTKNGDNAGVIVGKLGI